MLDSQPNRPYASGTISKSPASISSRRVTNCAAGARALLAFWYVRELEEPVK